MTVTNAQAVAVMRAAQLTPLVDYPGANAPWPCICDTCGQLTHTRYSRVQQGGRGCRPCGAKRGGATRRGRKMSGAKRCPTKLSTETAVAVMRAAGLTPLTEYENSRTPWPSTHICGRHVSPRLDSIRLGQGSCWICATRKYIPELSGCFYLLKSHDHPGYPSPVLKVGVTNNRGWTRKPGWKLLAEMRFADGTIPLAVERDVLTWLSGDLGLEPCRSATGTTTKGFAEAISIVNLEQAGFTVAAVVRRVMAVR